MSVFSNPVCSKCGKKFKPKEEKIFKSGTFFCFSCLSNLLNEKNIARMLEPVDRKNVGGLEKCFRLKIWELK